MNRRIAINLAFFALLFVLMTTWAVRNIVSVDAIDRPYRGSAEFVNAFGVLPNAEVTYLGVAYGRVTGVSRIPGGVRVQMAIKRDRKIPEGSSASILRKSAIGEPYIDFVPPDSYEGKGGPFYRSGFRVPMERTSVPLEFSELLRSASALVASVPPESLATLVRELSAGLNGRTESLRQLAESGDRLSATLAARTEAIDRLSENNARLTKVVADHRESLGQSLSDLAALAESLRSSSGDVTAVLDRGGELLGRTADVVSNQKPTLDCILKDLELLIDETTTPRRLAETQALLQIGPAAFAGIWDARDVEADGPWIRVGLIQNTVVNPPRQYTPPRELPPVNGPAACTSTLRPAGPDFRPAAATSGVERFVPTSPTELAATGAALALAAVATRAVRRRLGLRLRSPG